MLQGSSAETVVVEKLINCTPLNTPLKPFQLFWKCIPSWAVRSLLCLSTCPFCKSLFYFDSPQWVTIFFFCYWLSLECIWLYPKIWTGQVGIIEYAVCFCVCTCVHVCIWEYAFEFWGSCFFFSFLPYPFDKNRMLFHTSSNFQIKLTEFKKALYQKLK